MIDKLKNNKITIVINNQEMKDADLNKDITHLEIFRRRKRRRAKSYII